ncbi:hypothetical protein P154DRAFT_40103, partial [Amniculicola lignicola CBS 123094]
RTICPQRLIEALASCFATAIPSVSPQRSAVVYASLIPTCPRICVCSTNWIALVASCGLFRMARRLFRPERSPNTWLRRFL